MNTYIIFANLFGPSNLILPRRPFDATQSADHSRRGLSDGWQSLDAAGLCLLARSGRGPRLWIEKNVELSVKKKRHR